VRWGLIVFGHGVASYGAFTNLFVGADPVRESSEARAVRWGLIVFGHGVASYDGAPFW